MTDNMNFVKTGQSYMDFFVNNSCRTNREETVKVIEGSCNSMCPKEEVILREKEKMVHVLEVVGDAHKLVKRYARPAADTNLAVAHNLRPFYILKKTVDYLLFEVTKRTDVSTLVIYNFVTDRLRAVRQDMIIQEIEPKLCISLLEPMIRFHIYYGYLLCEEAINNYSPTLNKNFLLECLKTCLYCYDELDMKNTTESQDINVLMDKMFVCSLEENNHQNLDQSLMEAIYVLTNLYDESPMWRLSRLKKSLRHSPTVRLAYRIAAASLHGNYACVCKSIDKLCPLMFCAVALFLPRVQRWGLRVVCAAYSARAGVPVGALHGWLRLAGARAPAAASHYGVSDGGLVRCQRAAFREDAPLLPPTKIEVEHLESKMNIDYILTYTHQASS